MRLVFFIIVFSLCSFSVFTQEEQDSTIIKNEIKIDKNENITPVEFDKSQIEKYYKDKEFDYSRERNPENWWENFKRKISNLWNSFWRKIFGDFQPGSWIGNFMNIAKYSIIGGVIFFIGWLFVRLNPGKALVKPAEKSKVLFSDEEEIIYQKDILKLIEKAKSQQNYRLAIRYYYLLILKTLKDQDLIQYQFEKTNQQYQQELKNTALAFQFNKITTLYDFIWYGNFQVNKNQFKEAEKEFENIQKQLKR